MSEVIVVSNRGPATVALDREGRFEIGHAAGGLAPSLAAALSGSRATWIAAAMSDAERAAAATPGALERVDGIEIVLLDIDAEVAEAAYSTVANDMLWFLHHNLFDRPLRPVFDRSFSAAWERYRAYNDDFAFAVAQVAAEGATVCFHDYHLSLVGPTLRRLRPDLETVHFTHTPFCTPEELTLLPDVVADELLEGLAGFGACGFHTARWAAAFADCCAARAVAAPAVFDCPLGSDAAQLTRELGSAEATAHRERLLERLGDRRLIFRSDRLELSKNLVRGFLAFEELLDTAPEWRGRVVFLARSYPSRTELADYQRYRVEVERVVERINERFAVGDDRPIEFVVEDDYAASLAGYSCYDVLLVNPIRDGMNLVAKEGPIVNDRDGVLVLSREAGAIDEMGGAALDVAPFDVSETAHAILQGLEMAPDERASRARRLRAAATALPPRAWHERVIAQARRPGAT